LKNSTAASIEKTKLRHEYVSKLFSEFTAASGIIIDVERAKMLLQLLHEREFSGEQYTIARQWILQGNPCRYGTLVLADFFPTEEQIESLGLDIQARIDKAYTRGENAGYKIGYDTASREYEMDTERLRLLSETKDQAEINSWKLRLDSREKELETRIATISEREQKCLEFERLESKRLAFMESTSNQ
jgi:hypothetical protein